MVPEQVICRYDNWKQAFLRHHAPCHCRSLFLFLCVARLTSAHKRLLAKRDNKSPQQQQVVHHNHSLNQRNLCQATQACRYHLFSSRKYRHPKSCRSDLWDALNNCHYFSPQLPSQDLCWLIAKHGQVTYQSPLSNIKHGTPKYL